MLSRRRGRRPGRPQVRADRGSHFAAWLEPALFTTEVRAAFRSLRLRGAPVIHGTVDGSIWLQPFSPHGLGGTRSLPDLLYGLGPLGWVRVPPRRHRDQHPGEVRHDLAADDLRPGDLQKRDIRPAARPDLAVAGRPAAPAHRSAGRPRGTGAPAIHQDPYAPRRIAR